MKKNFSPIIIFGIILLSIAVNSCSEKSKLSEEQFKIMYSNFQIPSEENTLWCYWYWINDDISKDGITKDLLAMKESGIGAAFIGNINPAGVDGKVPLFSDEWWECMVHAVIEGNRIGVDIGIFNCPGWSQSGGPWVKSDMAMRYLTFSETTVKGPENIKIQLVQPQNEFQDIRTLAFQAPAAEKRDLKKLVKKIKSTPNKNNLNELVDNNISTAVLFNKKRNETLIFELQLTEEIKARQISFTPFNELKCDISLYAIVNGNEQLISEFQFDRSKFMVNVGPNIQGPQVVSIKETVSDRFKIECKNIVGKDENVGFAEINISEAAVLNRFIEKQLAKMHPTPFPEWNTYVWDIQDEISDESLLVNQVLDISNNIDANGQLIWVVPEGEWTIMRIGMTPTGTKNSPSAPQGQGYEIDKMNSELVKVHFDNFVGEFLKRIPNESKSAFKYVIADSYEMGSQNWTDDYEVKFQKKYGYDPIKYLPVLSGRVVGSVEESERFLWDLRRSVADDVAYEYVGGLKKVSNENNLKLWLENYGHWGFPSEFMMYGGQSDLIGGEFWNEGTLGNIECKASSSTSHTYGKGRTSAEAFTASRKSYLRHPALLKKRGDWSFTEGINHLVLHLFIHQPDDGRIPGINAWFSTEFNRHNTWFSQAHYYFDYLRRCQYLLQQGKYVADVCYFIGESAPMMTGGRSPEIPKGYSYDYINAEVILNRLSVKDGKFVLPDGMSYRIMVLPPLKTMRPKVLAKIEQLIRDGGVVLGFKPEKSPSLNDFPECDIKVSELAHKIWGGEYKHGKMIHHYGEGIVFDGYDLESAFEFLNLEMDLDVKNDPILWTHRTMPGMELYFITNQSDSEIKIEPSFRVKDLKPQFWDAVTGEVRYLKDFYFSEGRTVVPMILKGAQSGFVLFTNVNDSSINRGWESNFPEPEIIKTIEGPFQVDFENKEIGPVQIQVFKELQNWVDFEDEKIKYYSGTAKYLTKFSIEEPNTNSDMFINLGEVAVMAEVKLNGKDIGGVWIAPYRLNISKFLRKGENELEIKVANLWRNRLIKDKNISKNKRYTWTIVDDISDGEALHPSGLLGPVTIEIIK